VKKCSYGLVLTAENISELRELIKLLKATKTPMLRRNLRILSAP